MAIKTKVCLSQKLEQGYHFEMGRTEIDKIDELIQGRMQNRIVNFHQIITCLYVQY